MTCHVRYNPHRFTRHINANVTSHHITYHHMVRTPHSIPGDSVENLGGIGRCRHTKKLFINFDDFDNDWDEVPKKKEQREEGEGLKNNEKLPWNLGVRNNWQQFCYRNTPLSSPSHYAMHEIKDVKRVIFLLYDGCMAAVSAAIPDRWPVPSTLRVHPPSNNTTPGWTQVWKQ